MRPRGGDLVIHGNGTTSNSAVSGSQPRPGAAGPAPGLAGPAPSDLGPPATSAQPPPSAGPPPPTPAPGLAPQDGTEAFFVCEKAVCAAAAEPAGPKRVEPATIAERACEGVHASHAAWAWELLGGGTLTRR
jgi:hypothetical protein